MIVTFPQPQMNYKSYPLDVQNFSITMQSFADDATIIQISYFSSGAVILNSNSQGDSETVYLNQLWTYDSFSAFILDELKPSPFNPTRKFSTAIVNLKFERESLG